jgi:hypothetical protein
MPSAYIVHILLFFIMEKSNKLVRTEVLTAAIMKSTILRGVKQCVSFVGYFTVLSVAILCSVEC